MLSETIALTTGLRRAAFDRPLWREIRPAVELGVARSPRHENSSGPPVLLIPGFLSLNSRQDGVVDWRACLDPWGGHRAVATTHCGMATSATVLDHIEMTLATTPAEGNQSPC